MTIVSFYLEGGIVNTVEIPNKNFFQVNVNVLDQLNNNFIEMVLEKQTFMIQKSKLLMIEVKDEK